MMVKQVRTALAAALLVTGCAKVEGRSRRPLSQTAGRKFQLLRPFDAGARSAAVVDPAADFAAGPVAAAAFRSVSAAAKATDPQAER